MSDAMTIQNYDMGGGALGFNEFKSGLIKFPGTATYLKYTIMALKEVADAIVVTDSGNTGDGTVTAASVIAGSIIPSVGAYNLECTAAVANGGVFKLENPAGAIVANNLALTVGAGAATVFNIAGMTFIVTDGAADFIVGDKFSLTVAADGDFVVYDPAGIGGAQEARYVLREAYTSTGAADIAARVAISGNVRASRLVIHGSAAGVGINDVIKDKLKHYSIIVLDSTDLSQLDNQ